MKKIYIFLFLLITTLVASQASAHKRLFILLGQSNMSGRAPIEDADMAVCPMVKLLNADGHFEVLRNPLNRFSNIRKDIAMQKLAPDILLLKHCPSNYRILYFLWSMHVEEPL